MSAKVARFRQIDFERAMRAAEKVYGVKPQVVFDPEGRIVIGPAANDTRPLDSFD